ncbi:MAG TPA: hypothetical protein VNH63_01880 [Gemmatimonadales bacterium]|nr:hypothetical protein [Gemmatimonadales bacterium]
MDIEGVLAIILIFGGGAAVGISFSPIGRAFAARIRGQSPGDAEDIKNALAEHRDALQTELDGVRHELGELGERMDFAERMLAQSREQALPKGGSGRA